MATKIDSTLKHDILMYLVKRGSLRDREAQGLRDRLRPRKRGRKKGWRKNKEKIIRGVQEAVEFTKNNA